MSTLRTPIGVLATLFFVHPVLATVSVYFQPATVTVGVNDIFVVTVVVDLPEPVLAWGLDLTIEDGGVLSLQGAPVLGSSWIATNTSDHDGLAGLAFPDSVAGMGVVLATISLRAEAIGEANLVLSVTPSDPTEGFGLDPVGFADVVFEPSHVSVVPEPVTLLLLASGGPIIGSRNRNRSSPVTQLIP